MMKTVTVSLVCVTYKVNNTFFQLRVDKLSQQFKSKTAKPPNVAAKLITKNANKNKKKQNKKQIMLKPKQMSVNHGRESED